MIITDSAFDPEAALRDFRMAQTGAGAVVSFTGLVRDEGARVSTLSLSHYPGMTEAEIARTAKQAEARWDLSGWQIIHRVGDMPPHTPIVFVATASAHRRSAFEAADFLMDYLKSDAPLWKSETRDGRRAWIEPKASDYDDKARWETE